MQLYEQNRFLRESPRLSDAVKEYYDRMVSDMSEESEEDAPMAIHKLSEFLYRHYGKKVIILLDEYDTPMQEAYVPGYWKEIVEFTRSMFNAAFKTNPWLERALLTGITCVSKESIFSDLNNLTVVTTTSNKYAECFGFTEQEVFAAMDELGRPEKQKVKEWYTITSDRESGFGRYDVLLEPKHLDSSKGSGPVRDAIIIEFKVRGQKRRNPFRTR